MFEKFARAFVRNPDGSWFCREPAHFLGPNGPYTITPGVTYRTGKSVQGYDVAKWLEDWRQQEIAPTGVEFL